MKKLELVLHFHSYIAHPYWPEMNDLVTIQKQSGMNRVRSEDKRDQALKRYLEKQGLDMAYYENLEKRAARPWYRANGADEGIIVIPRHQFSGCLVQASPSAPSGARFNQDQLRSLIQVSAFVTDKEKCDEVFSRYVMPKDGKGNPLSNQRRLTNNEVILDFDAKGTITFDPNDVKEKSVLDLLRYAGKYIGVGASRKMGYGRFYIVGDTPPKPTKGRKSEGAEENGVEEEALAGATEE